MFVNYVVMPLLAFIILFPILWMLVVSLKTEAETYTTPLRWIPENPTLVNYETMWRELNFQQYFINTLIIASLTTLMAVSIAAPSAYGFSRFRFRGASVLGTFILSTQMLPRVILIVPYYIIMRSLGLLNTYPSLVLINVAFALPFSIWMLRGYFANIPSEIDEAALVDGCTPTQSFFKVILPLAMPGIVATAIFSFLVGWNEFLFALSLTTDKSMFTLTVGLSSLIGEYKTLWNELMAAAIVGSLPAMILYAFLERFLVQGLVAGATKG